MSLYLKYRPKTIDELDLVGVRKVLTEMVAANKMAHAYLLTGPRGAGKTSTARIIARIVNCEHNQKKLGEPCNECAACKSILQGSAVDVIEMDAASNRGIDDIRELKEKIRLSPAQLPKKVYIIDEVHMLTNEAFNALLKTLEEPPAHSIFILCTTELHKVPETIVSRCVQIKFTKATSAELERSLTRVIKGEGRSVGAEAVSYLSLAVDGSFRDGVKVLEQVLLTEGEIGIAQIESVVAGRAGFEITPLLSALLVKDAGVALAKLDEAIAQGVELNYLLLTLMRGLRDKLIEGNVEVGVTKLIFALDDVARKLGSALDGELLVQTAIVEWCGVSESSDNSEKQKTRKINKPEISKASNEVEPVKATDGVEVWKKLLGSLNGDSITLGALLAQAGPVTISGDVLTISVRYGFHRDQLMAEKTRQKLEAAVSAVVGREMRVVCEVVVQDSRSKAVVNSQEQSDTMQEAIEIFSS